MHFFFFILLPVMTSSIELSPTGKNVCIIEESFTVPVMIEKWEEEDYKTTEWCMSIPPRCTRYKKRWVVRQVMEERVSKRQVPRCCQGFVPNGEDCKAYCHDPCRHGICSIPDVCTCFPGFRGPLCTAICARGSWGQNCTQSCKCQNDAFCNPMSGICSCTPGWRGKRCSDPCEDGYFGYECRRPCYCDGALCHHITGECFHPPTTETSTTEEIVTDAPTTSTTTTTEILVTSTATSSISYSSSSSTTTEMSTTTSQSTSEATTTTTSQSTSEATTTTETEQEGFTFIANINYKKNELVVTGQTTGKKELAGLVWAITSGLISSIIILCAIAGFAFLKRRKPPQPPLNTDTGLYRFYADIPQPVFQNPTYGIGAPEELSKKSNLQTFKNEDNTFEIELREILEAQYDHLPLPRTRTPTPYDHLYDEIMNISERPTSFS